MKIPIVYIKDSLIFRESEEKTPSIFVQDNVSFDQNSNYHNTTSILIQSVYLYDNHSYQNKTTYVFDELLVKQQNFYVFNSQITIEDNFTVSEIKYEVSNVDFVQCKQIVRFHENWCNSDNTYNSNIIQYYINADILVNDVLYNSFNISRYKFDISDDFDFFVNCKDILLQKDNYITNKVYTDVYQISGQKHILTKKQLLSQKVQVDNKQHSVISNIDGIIVNNRIHLSVGKHTIKIKRYNSTKVFLFDIQVLSPYRRQFDKIYMLDLYDLKNAKYYSNYEIQQNQVEIFDNNLKIS